MESQGVFAIIGIALRIIGAFYCSSRAKELNRSSGGWVFFGFIMPIIAIIWIQFMKPKMVWDESDK